MAKPGRPAKPKHEPLSFNKSIRLRNELWAALDEKAESLGLRTNTAVGQAIAEWLGDVTLKPQPRPAPRPWPVRPPKPPAPKSTYPEPTPEEKVKIDKILGRGAFAESERVHVSDLLSTPPGAKMSAPREPTRWDWAKPEKREKK